MESKISPVALTPRQKSDKHKDAILFGSTKSMQLNFLLRQWSSIKLVRGKYAAELLQC